MRVKRIIYYFPHPFYPVRTGAHVRVLQTLQSLSRLGFEVSCAYGHLKAMTQDQNHRQALSESLCKHVFYYEKPPHKRPKYFLDTQIEACAKGRNFENLVEADYFSRCDEEMRFWFLGCLEKTGADAAFFSYASNLSLIPKDAGVRKIIELFDTEILNWDMQQLLSAHLLDARNNLADIYPNHIVLSRSFLSENNCHVSVEELSFIRSFDAGIALTNPDEALLRSQQLSPTACIPIMMDPKSGGPDYERGQPCLMLGPNNFNLQGLLHFDLRIIPRIAEGMRDFRVNLYGSVPHLKDLKLHPCITNEGFVPDISVALRRAAFFVNPVFSGTGMQIKTVEAMAHGLPVVCYPEVARSAGIKHRETGYIAKDEQDFADGIALLFQDRAVTKELGQNALDYIASNLSCNVMDAKMAAFMGALEES